MKLLQDGPSRFVDWGFLHLSIGNLVVITAMVVLFILALVVPFPGHRDDRVAPPATPEDATAPRGGLR